MDLLREAVLQLRRNSKEIYEETIRLLIKIADNVIKEPLNLKLRSLQKSNTTVSNKILNVSGGLECLRLMGFEEKESTFLLPPCITPIRLQTFRDYLSESPDDSFEELLENVSLNSSSSSSSCSSLNEGEPSQGAIPKVLMKEPVESEGNASKSKSLIPPDVPKVNLPPIEYMFTNPFLRGVELSFHMALAYADKDLQKKALSLIPLSKLEISAQKRLRVIQEEVKKGNLKDADYLVDDFLLLELLAWFKNEFFTWIDSPACQYCGGQCYFVQMSEDPTLMINTNRVEMHKCQICQQFTLFPRYNDVNILLITRSGRCGEWANTFTLLCCAMGWEARLVVDQGDHVWTEVFMHSQKRWLHCDPCENVCDTPLMYENGWGKQLSYVIAYSAEELQDVTWRYSSNHKALLSRRTQCSERELIDALIILRTKRQKNLSKARVDYLTKRLLNELVELMTEKQSTDRDSQGRTSGSELWRLARGEIQPQIESSSWMLKKNDTERGNATVQYSTSLDRYEYLGWDGLLDFRLGWQAGVFKCSNIFRKEEKDWKMVYLARTEGADLGQLSWKFEVENPGQVIDVVKVRLQHKLYENGKLEVTIANGTSSIHMPQNVEEFRTSAVSGSRFIIITVSLSNGIGNVAWQHAQIFRQGVSSSDYPFMVEFSFKPSS